MAFGQFSFRKLILYRLLLVSLPVLLIGVYITYRKARSALLETARQNLTESAIQKADHLNNSIKALQGNLITVSDSEILLTGSATEKKDFLTELSQLLPTDIQCIQLTEPQSNKIVSSTCGNQPLKTVNYQFWSEKKATNLLANEQIYIQITTPIKPLDSQLHQSHLEIIFYAPVYDQNNQLKFILAVQTNLIKPEKITAGLLTGYTVIIDQDGTILAVPDHTKVGRNISEMEDHARLNNLLQNAIAGRQNFVHLFVTEPGEAELLAGYTAINSPITGETNQKWAVISVTYLDQALAKLKAIRQVLLYLTLAIIGATILAILYLAHSLSRPLEKLRDYALGSDFLQSDELIPQNSNIKEIDQLANALNNMLAKAKEDATKLRFAWQEAESSNRLKSEFLANTSHELRTPLNGIINCVRIVKEDYCDSRNEEKEFLQQADEAAIHLLSIINDVLDISKIEAGKVTLSMAKVSLNRILKQVIDLQILKIQEKNLTLIKEEVEGEIIVNADRDKLRQVLINVLANSVKFTDSGSILVKVELVSIGDQQQSTEENTSPQRVIITVKDTGIGIDPKDQDKLFRPFVMVDGSTTRKCEGTGLGLAISLNLIKLMGGNISLVSEGLGKGTTVEVSLPVVRVEKTA